MRPLGLQRYQCLADGPGDELPGECANLISFTDEIGTITFPTHEWDNKDKKFIEKTYNFFEQVQKICEGAEQRTNNENTQDNE